MKKHNETELQKRSLKKASELGENAGEKDIQEIESKLARMKKGILLKVWGKVTFLWDCFNSPDVSKATKVKIIGALLYLILPSDIVPDFIPGIGFLDDISVIVMLYNELKSLAPKIIKRTEEKIFESNYKKIDEKLSEIFRSTMVSCLSTLFLNVLACVILILRPFGDKPSFWCANLIFISLFAYTIFSVVRYLRTYGKASFTIAGFFFEEKNLEKSVARYIKMEYRWVSRVYAGIDVAKSFFDFPIPDLDQIVRSFLSHYRKKAVLFAVLIVAYALLIAAIKIFVFRNGFSIP